MKPMRDASGRALDHASLSVRRRIGVRPDGRAAAHERCRRTERLQPRCLMALPAWRQDACAVDLTTTIVHATASLTREAWTPASNAQIDCFYVYPTVSTDPTPMSDMVADDAERNVIRQQFARFGFLVPPLRSDVSPGHTGRDCGPCLPAGAGVVRSAAVRSMTMCGMRGGYYLEHDNRGRGVVLVGHSQGSFILAELIRQEIDGKPTQSRLVSAISARCDPERPA
jgi:hypothetical protein